MRLKARAKFEFHGTEYKREDILDVADDEGRLLLNRDVVMPWNLEDPAQRSAIPEDLPPTEALPDVPPVTISPTEDTVLAAGETGSFDVTVTGAGASGTWTVDKDSTADWLTVVSPATPQSASGPVSYDVAPNAGDERVAHMYVNGKTYTVTQVSGLSGATRKRR